MGCGSSNTVAMMIELDRANGYFFTGELVSGTVKLFAQNDKLEANEIDLNLIGEAGYTTRHRRSGKHHGSTTHHHHEQFLVVKHILARRKDGEKEITFAKDQCTFPFQLQLPAHLPPSINHPQAYPHVRYYLQMYIDRAWYTANTQQNQYITVMPRVSLVQHPSCLTPTIFGNQNRKDVSVKGTLSKVGYLPGETIQGTIEIENSQQVLIKQVNVSLVEDCQIGRSTKHNTVTNGTIIELTQRRDSQIRQSFAIPIPQMSMIPTYQFDGGMKDTTSIRVNYMLTFKLDVEGIFTDFDVSIPIVIANV